MAKQLWVPRPEPSVWDKIKCFFGIHEYDSPTEETDWSAHFKCHGKCGSYLEWNKGLPIYGKFFLFGKASQVRIKVTYLEDK